MQSIINYFYEKYGSYKWNSEELYEAHRYCQDRFMDAIKNNVMLDIETCRFCTSPSDNVIFLRYFL
jgi:hypothetical protein